MRKRLDLQSLLEKCDQDQLTGFLRSSFAKDPNLATHFLVHFASTFDFEEEDFQHVTKRISRLLSYRPEKMSKRKMSTVSGYLQDLIEQSRDSISKGNFRQAYVMLSGINTLIDPYLDRIPDDLGLPIFQQKIYHFLGVVWHETPAPSLKKKIVAHLTEIIESGKAIPFYEDENPYQLWRNAAPFTEKRIIAILDRKILEWPEYKSLFLRQRVRMVAEDPEKEQMEHLFKLYGNELDLYQYISEYLPEEELPPFLKNLLDEQYEGTSRRSIRGKIYHIFQNRKTAGTALQELSLSEFLETGDIRILDTLLQGELAAEDIPAFLTRTGTGTDDASQRLHMYRGLEYAGAYGDLKEQLMKDPDIFVLLQFIDPLYERFPGEIQNRMWTLIEKYLNDHFGLPAFHRINEIIEALSPVRYDRLQNFLIQKIRNTFGHRKHFQKLMKELAR